jgi:hypothetical protein
MKKETLFLKVAVILMGIPALALCVFGLPAFATDAADGSREMAYVLYGLMAMLGATAIPYFIALFQVFRLLIYIDGEKAFTQQSVEALKRIKYCGIGFSAVCFLGMPLFYIMAELDDAPGVILVGAVFVFAPLVIAVFAAVLQKLLQAAIDLKMEQELTI